MSANRHDELAARWLQAAGADLSLAEIALREGFHAHACFNCQQAAEKALKAYLFSQRRDLVRTHFLPRLLEECQAINVRFSELADACFVLTGYYTDTRYPDAVDAHDAYDAATAREALGLAHSVVGLVRDTLGAP
jgi:HEPN domain-containing protein